MRRSLLVPTLLLSLLPCALATFAQGTVDVSRDSLINYSPEHYADTEDFCHTFHHECYKHAVGANHHHQVDCVFDQPGHDIRAYCGGLLKDSNGDFDRTDETTSFTEVIMKKVPHAKIMAGPDPLVAPSPSTGKNTQPIEIRKRDHIPGHPKSMNKSYRKRPVVEEKNNSEENKSTRTERKVVARAYPTHNQMVPLFQPAPPIAKKALPTVSSSKPKPKKVKKIAPKVEKTLFESKSMGQAQRNHLAAASFQHSKLKNKGQGHRDGKMKGKKNQNGNDE